MGFSDNSGPATILIVEHEAIVRLELRSQLSDWGYIVLEARDAAEAIALLDEHSEIVILITDMKMPGSMDGMRLAHHVRDRWPPVKIIVTSGAVWLAPSDFPKDSRFLPKPYGPEALAGVLAQYSSGLSGPAEGVPGRYG